MNGEPAHSHSRCGVRLQRSLGRRERIDRDIIPVRISVLDRRRSVLDEAPLIRLVPESLVEIVRLRSVVPARDLDPSAIVPPREHFSRRYKRTAYSPALMILTHGQG